MLTRNHIPEHTQWLRNAVAEVLTFNFKGHIHYN